MRKRSWDAGFFIAKLLIVFALFVSAQCVFSDGATNQSMHLTNTAKLSERETLRLVYHELSKTRYFAPINVKLEGSAARIGLDQKELTDFLTLKFRNTFTGYQVKEPSREVWMSRPLDSAWGSISVRIWTVGEKNSIVSYHLALRMSRFLSGECGYEDEMLGYSSAHDLTQTRELKDNLVTLLERAATLLMKVQEP
jgi:hypothetical protein